MANGAAWRISETRPLIPWSCRLASGRYRGLDQLASGIDLSEEISKKRRSFQIMSTVRETNSRTAGVAVNSAEKRVILSMGGKGGVGKTGIMVALAEWFESNQLPVKLLDLDTENKSRGSLAHFFNGNVPKVNIHTPAG